MKSIFLIFLMVIVTGLGAATITDNNLKLGDGTITGDKSITFDNGSGTSNKKIKLDPTTGDIQSTSNKLKIGDGASSDKTIQFNDGSVNPTIKFNSSTSDIESSANIRAPEVKVGSGANKLRVSGGNLEFTNDGSLFKKIGSGSGSGSGGINILVNSSFEDGVPSPGWTSSGGTFTQGSYSNTKEDDLKFAQFVASGSGQYIESSLTVIPDNLGAGCQAQFEKYATATDGAWKIVVLDSSSNVLATQNFNQSGGASTFISTPLLSFPCPAAGATAKIRIESLAAATIKLDLAYLGGNKNTADIAQARLAQSAFIAGTASCTVNNSSSSSYVLMGSAAACPGPTSIISSSVGTMVTTDTDKIEFTVNNLPPGNYRVVISAPTQGSTTGSSNCYRITDGTNIGQASCVQNTGTNPFVSVNMALDVSYSTAGNKTFSIQSRSTAGSSQIVNAGTGEGTTFAIMYFPSDSQTAVTSDQSGWFIDANIGGADPSLGLSAVSSYTGIENASLDMVLRAGSAQAKIGCSSTNSPTGLTCGVGSESVSVAWEPPFAGWFDVCFDFSHRLATDASGDALNTTFQVVETATNSQTVVSEGGSKIFSRIGSGLVGSLSHPYSLCGSFYASNVSQKMHRLMFEQGVASTPTESYIPASRDSSLGQFDIRVTVRPSTQNTSRPVLTGDQVTSPGSTGKIVQYSAKISATDVVSDEIGEFISGDCTNATTGKQTCVFSKTFSKINCIANAESNGSGDVTCHSVMSGTTSVEMTGSNNNVNANLACNLFCHGVE